MSEWKECKLGNITEFTNGKSRPSETENGTIPIYGGNGILGFTDKFNCQGETVIVGRVGAYCGSVYFESKPIWVSDNALYAIPKNNTDAKFLYYLLKSMDLNNQAEGSSHPLLTQTLLSALNVLITDCIPEQRAIAGVLSSLDDKIDLLHRQNKTLDAMAEALWRKMFVEEADPEWVKARLGDYGEFKNGINYSRNEKGDTEYSILNVRDIVESKYASMSNLEKVSISSRRATPYLLKEGDVVIARSASPGESSIVLEEIDDLIYSGFSIRLRCYDKRHSIFLFQFLQNFKKEMEAFSDGTTLRNINQGILNSIELLSPPEDTVNEFNDRVGIIYNRILLNQGQILTLSNLRDMLLPKLMPGEVRVQHER